MTNLNFGLGTLLAFIFVLASGRTVLANPPSVFDKIQSGSLLLARQPGGAPALSFSETELTFREVDLNPAGYRSCNLFLAGGISVDGFTVSIDKLSPDELAPLASKLGDKTQILPTHRLTLNNLNPGAVKLSGLGSSTVYLIHKRDDSGGETLRGRGLFLLQNHDVHVYTPARGTLFVKGLENAAAQSVQMTAQLTPASAYYYLVCNLGIQ